MAMFGEVRNSRNGMEMYLHWYVHAMFLPRYSKPTKKDARMIMAET